MFVHRSVAVEQASETTWVTTRSVIYWSSCGVRVIAPPGYETDFATIPRFLWWLCPRYGLYTAATIVHDYLLTDLFTEVSSRDIDRIFREAMAELGVSFPRRWLMWVGVRWGALFNKKRRAGSLGTFPGVLLISLLALPFVLPAVAVLPSLVLFNLLERLTK